MERAKEREGGGGARTGRTEIERAMFHGTKLYANGIFSPDANPVSMSCARAMTALTNFVS